MMTGKEKLYFLLEAISDKRVLTPSRHIVLIHPVEDLNKHFPKPELLRLLFKLQSEEKIFEVVRFPQETDVRFRDYDDECYGLRLLPAFDDYYLQIQNEPEYQEFTGKRPPTPKPQKEVIKEQEAQLALRPTILPRYRRQTTKKVNPKETANEFSSQNYPFVLMVLEKVASLTEFSADNKVHYQLQSPPGQSLIQERALLKKFESRGLFRHLGEDGVFGIATLNNIDIEMIRKIVTEIKRKQLEKENGKTIKDIVPAPSGSDKPRGIKQGEKIVWSEDFKWQGKSFVFGKYGKISFNSKVRKALFQELTKAKGGWVAVRILKLVTDKNDSYVRPTIGQIEREMKPELRKYISIPSTEENDLQFKPQEGAYRIRIRFTAKPL